MSTRGVSTPYSTLLPYLPPDNFLINCSKMGTSLFVQKVMEHNFCTWYLLPLIQLSKDDFGSENFVESYVNQAGTQLMVQVMDANRCPDLLQHPCYINSDSTELMQFTLPVKWQPDFQYFTKGQYSQFSDEAIISA